tara:strand:+ start:133 stop:396 length:264 start_codon:yes stop_codon:yes gene_type:complete
MIDNKQKNRELVIDAIKETDPDYFKEGNVYYFGARAFVANSVVQWLVEKMDSGEFPPENVDFYMESINKYIKGEINLRWENENLVVE